MKILVADAQALVRKGYQQIVTTRAGWRVAAEAANEEEIFAALRGAAFDVLILDAALDRHRGVDVLTRIRDEFPAPPVLVVSMHPDEQYAIRCLRAGASGFIPKDSSPEVILEAIARVAAGGRYITPALAEHLADKALTGTERPHDSLSAREFEVFRLIALGHGVTEIAQILDLSAKTVSTYRTRILEKTRFRSNAAIIAYAIRNSLV